MATQNFSITLEDTSSQVTGSIIYMEQSCWIWINDSNSASFGTLDVVMPSKYDDIPLTSSLIKTGDESSIDIARIAQRLSKKLGIQIFISGQVQADRSNIVEAKLKEILSSKFLVS